MSTIRSNNSSLSCCTSDCKKQYGKCSQTKHHSQIKYYQKQLQELNIVFYLALERYKKSYPLKIASPTSENTALYNESQSKLDDTFNDLFILESQINADIDNSDTTIQKQDDKITALKRMYGKDKKLLNNVRDTNLATYPMKREFQESRFHGYLNLAYYMAGLLLLLYLLFTAIKGSKIPTARMAKGPPWRGVSSKTGKIVTGMAAAVAAIIAAYYG